MKDDSRISGKRLLVLSVTVDYLARRRIGHFRHVVGESKYGHGLAARRRSGDDGRKWMFNVSISYDSHLRCYPTYLQHFLLLLFLSPSWRQGRAQNTRRARLSFVENESHQSGNGAHCNHSCYPYRIVLVRHRLTVRNGRYCRTVFNRDNVWRVSLCACYLHRLKTRLYICYDISIFTIYQRVFGRMSIFTTSYTNDLRI